MEDSFNEYYKNNKSYVYLDDRGEFNDEYDCEDDVEIKNVEKPSQEEYVYPPDDSYIPTTSTI